MACSFLVNKEAKPCSGKASLGTGVPRSLALAAVNTVAQLLLDLPQGFLSPPAPSHRYYWPARLGVTSAGLFLSRLLTVLQRRRCHFQCHYGLGILMPWPVTLQCQRYGNGSWWGPGGFRKIERARRRATGVSTASDTTVVVSLILP